MTKPTLTLTTVLDQMGPATAVVLTDEQVASFGAGKTFGVLITIGQKTEPGRLTRMGGQNLIGLSKAKRQALGVEFGDEVEVTIELDDLPRQVEVPPALADALDRAGLREAFDALAPSRRKEHARQVVEAKKDETRDRRIQKIIDGLAG